MGKLSIEEKAKAYDEALERAWALYNDKNEIGYANAESVLEEVFPLLKESKDERIRKEIINYFVKGKEYLSLCSFSKEEILAWLGKQAEQKLPIEKLPSEMKTVSESLGFATQKECDDYNKMVTDLIMSDDDKVKPKFRVGDWVVSPNGVYWHIDAIQNGRYEVTANTGQCGNWPLDTNIYRLWTIQDAKDGDVLTNGDFPCIFKRCDGNGSLYVYCGINAHNDFSILSEDSENVWDDYPKQYFPATKEQCNLLFQKMKEAGYEWDAEKKELKKIEQKSVWSEEDEHRVKDTIYFLETAKKHYASTVELGACIDWLKSLKPQNRDIYNPYKEVVSSIAEMCDKYKSFSDDRANDFVNNVKVKCKDAKEYDSIYPQNTWKPSDDQIQALKEACDKSWEPDGLDPLYTLYEQLKKLREE